MLLGTLRASLLGNMLTRKGILRAGYGSKQGKGMLRASYGSEDHRFKKVFDSIPSFNKYYQNQPRFNGIYSRDHLPKKIKDGHM